jgi:hypothetical protein
VLRISVMKLSKINLRAGQRFAPALRCHVKSAGKWLSSPALYE